MANERRRVLFFGQVQGVGFRFTVRRIAKQHQIAGFVRNLSDGSVESVVEGDEKEIDSFLAHIERTMEGYIERREQDKQSFQGEFSSFAIEH